MIPQPAVERASMNPFPTETGSEGTSFGLEYPFPVKIKTEREESPRMLPQGGFQAAKVICFSFSV